MIDLDYSSRELFLWPRLDSLNTNWDFNWTFGLRILTLFFDSRAAESFAQAAAGNGIFQKGNSNNLAGLGPHLALELTCHLGDSGWSLWCRTDLSQELDWITEGFSARSTALGPNGQPGSGSFDFFGHQGTQIVNVQAGVTWEPSRTSATRVFLGYQYEHFWALSPLQKVGFTGSTGQLTDQGIILQATFPN